jgi:flagella basal body P-ring formation protein FlgA
MVAKVARCFKGASFSVSALREAYAVQRGKAVRITFTIGTPHDHRLRLAA